MRKQGRSADKEILLQNSNPRDRDVPGFLLLQGVFLLLALDFMV